MFLQKTRRLEDFVRAAPSSASIICAGNVYPGYANMVGIVFFFGFF